MNIGASGMTQTCNQTVTSGRIQFSFVDFVAFSSEVERVRCVLARSFLVRNWCGCQSKPGFGTNPANGRLSVSIFEQFNNESRGGRPNRCGQNPPFLRLSYERTQFVFEPMMRRFLAGLNCKHNTLIANGFSADV
jgi:hypothetical protein